MEPVRTLILIPVPPKSCELIAFVVTFDRFGWAALFYFGEPFAKNGHLLQIGFTVLFIIWTRSRNFGFDSKHDLCSRGKEGVSPKTASGASSPPHTAPSAQ